MTTLENSIDDAEDALDSISQASETPPLFKSILAKRWGVPFAHTLKQRFEVNSSFLIEGTSDEYAEGFTINLCHKYKDQNGRVTDDILLHVNPRFNLNCVVRNSRVTDSWGREEIRTFRRSPFKRGNPFYLEIFVTSQEFMMAVNGGHFCDFKHRKPVDLLNYLEIDGDIALHKVELVSKKYYPTQPPQSISSSEAHTAPLTMAINKMPVNTVVTITGRVGLLPYNFHINLQIGRYVHPHPIIPFHMSARWRPSEGDIIVFNTWSSGQWHEEVRVPLTHDMFAPGQRFHLLIAVRVKGYEVTVNEKRLPTFKHRFDSVGIDTLYIQGDVRVRDVRTFKEEDDKRNQLLANKSGVKLREKIKKTIS